MRVNRIARSSYSPGRIAVVLHLLLVLSIGDGAFWIYAGLSRYLIRRDVAETIREGSAGSANAVIVIANLPESRAEITWTDEGREFSYRGELYDVVDSSATPDSVRYNCIKDGEETELQSRVTQYGNHIDITQPLHAPDAQSTMCSPPSSPAVKGLYPRIMLYGYPSFLQYDDPALATSSPPPEHC